MSDHVASSQCSTDTVLSQLGRKQTITFSLGDGMQRRRVKKERPLYKGARMDAANPHPAGAPKTDAIYIIAPPITRTHDGTKRNARTDVMHMSLTSGRIRSGLVTRPTSSPPQFRDNSRGYHRMTEDTLKPPQSTMVHVGMAAHRPSKLPQPGKVTFQNLEDNGMRSSTPSNSRLTQSLDDSSEHERYLAERVARRKEREAMERVMSSKPVSVSGPFLVSSPHWASRTHTQKWSWRGSRLHPSVLTFEAVA